MRVTERTCEISSLQALSENWQLLEAWEATWYIGQRARPSPGEPAGNRVSEFLAELLLGTESCSKELQTGTVIWSQHRSVGEWKYSIFKSYTHILARREWTHISEYCVDSRLLSWLNMTLSLSLITASREFSEKDYGDYHTMITL